jgi:hypothetical protein
VGIIKRIIKTFEGSRTVGIKLVVGSDSRAKLEAMAAEVGSHAFLDTDETLWHQLGARGVPHFFLVDDEGTIIEQGAGGGAAMQMMHQVLQEQAR